MFRIYIKGFGPKELARVEVNCRKATNAGVQLIANKIVEQIKNNILSYGLYWRGYLFDRVKANPIRRSGVAISTIFYGPMIEKGHRIPAGVRIPTLVAWARQKLPQPELWLKKVFREGWYVQRRPFITDAIDLITPRIKDLMLLKLKQVK